MSLLLQHREWARGDRSGQQKEEHMAQAQFWALSGRRKVPDGDIQPTERPVPTEERARERGEVGICRVRQTSPLGSNHTSSVQPVGKYGRPLIK